MSGRQHDVARVRRLEADQIVVTCEHASNALPRGFGRLGVSPAVLRSHVAWDPGARELASILAHRLGCAHFAGRYSRLLVDLNRSRGSRSLIPVRHWGATIPGNRRLSRRKREERIAKYYTPYRETVEAAIHRAIERGGNCLHLSVHTFAPTLGNEVRKADIGLLYDPKRKAERRLVSKLQQYFVEAHLETRLNYPYLGTADGFTTSCRKRFPKSKYCGIELEINQRTIPNDRAIWRIGRLLTEAVAGAIDV